MTWWWIGLGVVGAVVVYDLVQRKHAILRNFPIIGHFRYLLEAVGPELRQYIVTDNNDERPFTRDERRWVYASSKGENTYFGFGSDNEMELAPSYLIIKHQTFALPSPVPGDAEYDPDYAIPAAKVLGESRHRLRAFQPPSVVNISAMSYGSLSGAAVQALNKGAAIAGCLHNTGEGGVSEFHLGGGDLVMQIGTGYFGCREADGRFSMPMLKDVVARHPKIRAIEVKWTRSLRPRDVSQLSGYPGALVAGRVANRQEVEGIPVLPAPVVLLRLAAREPARGSIA